MSASTRIQVDTARPYDVVSPGALGVQVQLPDAEAARPAEVAAAVVKEVGQ